MTPSLCQEVLHRFLAVGKHLIRILLLFPLYTLAQGQVRAFPWIVSAPLELQDKDIQSVVWGPEPVYQLLLTRDDTVQKLRLSV